jgi:hypothetical protein
LLGSRGNTPEFDHSGCSPALHKSCICVNFIAEHTRAKEIATKVQYMEKEEKEKEESKRSIRILNIKQFFY